MAERGLSTYIGMDEVWIRLTRGGYRGMLMEDEDLAIISRVELSMSTAAEGIWRENDHVR